MLRNRSEFIRAAPSRKLDRGFSPCRPLRRKSCTPTRVMLSVCAKHPSAQIFSEMATARNITSESAEGLVVKSLAKAKLQFPLMTEKFESSFVSSVSRRASQGAPRFLFFGGESEDKATAGAGFFV